MNQETLREALDASKDIREMENLKKTYESECKEVREAIAKFIYSKVKDTEEFQKYLKNAFDDYWLIYNGKKYVEVIESYMAYLFYEDNFYDFMDQIGLDDFINSDAIGEKGVCLQLVAPVVHIAVQ